MWPNITREHLQQLRRKYPSGTRVVLVSMDDPYTLLPPGTEGVVTVVDDAGTVHVNWSTGSTLGVIPGVDVIEIKNSLPNTKVSYLYRDASNYKTQNEVVLCGSMPPQDIQTVLDCCEGADHLFIPEQIGWPLFRGWDIGEDDHCYCELNGAELSFAPTADSPTVEMSVSETVQAFLKAKGNWHAEAFNPLSRKGEGVNS